MNSVHLCLNKLRDPVGQYVLKHLAKTLVLSWTQLHAEPLILVITWLVTIDCKLSTLLIALISLWTIAKFAYDKYKLCLNRYFLKYLSNYHKQQTVILRQHADKTVVSTCFTSSEKRSYFVCLPSLKLSLGCIKRMVINPKIDTIPSESTID
jgi:hypothetical protein